VPSRAPGQLGVQAAAVGPVLVSEAHRAVGAELASSACRRRWGSARQGARAAWRAGGGELAQGVAQGVPSKAIIILTGLLRARV